MKARVNWVEDVMFVAESEQRTRDCAGWRAGKWRKKYGYAPDGVDGAWCW